jgi:hypothetical protein
VKPVISSARASQVPRTRRKRSGYKSDSASELEVLEFLSSGEEKYCPGTRLRHRGDSMRREEMIEEADKLSSGRTTPSGCPLPC